MKKRRINLSENYLHKILHKTLRESAIEDMDGLHDDLNLTSTSLDDDNNFDDLESDESYLQELGQEAIDLADRLYGKLEEMCDECRNINDPSFDEYELEELRDSAETVMNGLGGMFGDPSIYGDL